MSEVEHFKVLGNATRVLILRMLMAEPATLSRLGQSLGEHPAKVRHHLMQLEQAGLAALVETRITRGFVEKFYQATAHAFIIDGVILPAFPGGETILAMGSHDLALEILAQRLTEGTASVRALALPVGSLDGLVALRRGIAHLAGCHLLDADSGEYNLPYVRHLFPDRPTILVTLAHRQQGLLVASGNPHGIDGLVALARPEVRFINRNRGSGTRLWLDHQLHQAGIPVEQLNGYHREASTHTFVAEAVASGEVDVGLGLQAAAARQRLDFVPLFQERYDLVVPEEQFHGTLLQPLFDLIHSGEFRRSVAAMDGYDTTHTGEQFTP